MALQGTLDTFALPDVLRLLASTKKTGRLLITGDRGTGSVWVDSGSVIGTEASGALTDAGAVDVVFELLRYVDGSFTFEAGSAPTDPVKARAVEPLLVDAERQLSEWREIEAVVPSMDAWVTLVAEIEGDDITVAAARWKAIVAIGSGTSVTGVGHTLRLGELDVCRQVKELVEAGLARVTVAPMPTLSSLDGGMFNVDMDAAGVESPSDVTADGDEGSGATWDPFSIEIPGVAPLGTSDTDDETATAEDTHGDDGAVVSVVEPTSAVDDEPAEADEVAMQLASLSPKAARAVAAAARAATDEEREAALAEAAEEDDEPINRGLLLKFLSSVKS